MADENPGVETIEISKENLEAAAHEASQDYDVEPEIDVRAEDLFPEAADDLTEPPQATPTNEFDFSKESIFEAEQRAKAGIGHHSGISTAGALKTSTEGTSKKDKDTRSFINEINQQLNRLNDLYNDLGEVEERLAINYRNLTIAERQIKLVEEQLQKNQEQLDRIEEEIKEKEDCICEQQESIEEKEQRLRENPRNKALAEEIRNAKEELRQDLEKLEELKAQREEILNENETLKESHDRLKEKIDNLKTEISDDEELRAAIIEEIEAEKESLLEQADTPEQREALLSQFEILSASYKQERLVTAKALEHYHNGAGFLQDGDLQNFSTISLISDKINNVKAHISEMNTLRAELEAQQDQINELSNINSAIQAAIDDSSATNRNEFLVKQYDGYEAQSTKAKLADIVFNDYHVANADGFFNDINNIVSTEDGQAVYRDFETNSLFTLDENGNQQTITDDLTIARLEYQAWVEGKPYANECAYGDNKIGDLVNFLTKTKKAMETIDTQEASVHLTASAQRLENHLTELEQNSNILKQDLLELAQDGYLKREDIEGITTLYANDEMFLKDLELAYNDSLQARTFTLESNFTLTETFTLVSNNQTAPDMDADINKEQDTPAMTVQLPGTAIPQ